MSRKKFADLSAGERAAYAKRVKSLRQSLDMTQQELASAAGVTRQTVNGLENGASIPQAEVLAKVLSVLGIEVNEPQFEVQTELWLTMMGTLIEAVPEVRREETVGTAMRVLSDGVRSTSNVRPLRNVGPAQHTELAYAAHEEPGGHEATEAEQEGEPD
jgi:transcriptional regulator with XRE-family HTH domain